MVLQCCLTCGTLSANHPNILETSNCLSAESFTPANRVAGSGSGETGEVQLLAASSHFLNGLQEPGSYS